MLRLSPQHKPHATFMQPLQCVWQHHVAGPHLSTHMATQHDNIHAAITLRSATKDSRNEKNYAHMNNQSLQNMNRGESDLRSNRAQPHPPHAHTHIHTHTHTRCLSSPAAATLHGKTHGFVLRLSPQHKPHATFMQPLQCVWQHHVAGPHLSTHMATQHYNNHAAITLRSATTEIQETNRTICKHEQPLVAEHRGGTDSRIERGRTRRTHTRGACHRRLQPLYKEKHTVSCSGFPSNTSPMQHPCSFDTAICNQRFNKRKELRMHSVSIYSQFSLFCDVISHTTIH